MSKTAPTPIWERSGCKVGWLGFATRADAEAYVEGVRERAADMAAQGYDFGYCVPGQIQENAKGEFVLTIP
jgi:alpha/beta superfamily hydrolase